MKKYRVPVKVVMTYVLIITAPNKEVAMNVALEAVNDDNREDFVDEVEGDAEVYYPDITEEP